MRQYRAWFICSGIIIAAILAVFVLRADVGAWMLAAKMKLWPETRQAETRTPAMPTRDKTGARPVNLAEQSLAVVASQQEQPPRIGGSRKDEYKFDVVRIDPDGASVFAGRAPANSTVTVLANEQPIATPKADENGEWAAVVERKFTAGEYKLALSSRPGQPADGQAVSLTVPRTERAVAPAKETIAVPQEPITFLYNEAEFAPEGYRAAAVLSQYVRARGLTILTLSGHADERGSHAYNMELSRQRLAAVERYLRARGFDGKLVLLPKGDLEPFALPNRDALEREYVYQLDRRVELRVYR